MFLNFTAVNIFCLLTLNKSYLRMQTFQPADFIVLKFVYQNCFVSSNTLLYISVIPPLRKEGVGNWDNFEITHSFSIYPKFLFLIRTG